MLFQSFISNNNSVKKNMNKQQALFFFLLKKTKPIQQKLFDNGANKNQAINILGFKSIELACKYRIISQMSIYNWMQNCIFRYFWHCFFYIFKIKLQLIGRSDYQLKALSPAQIAILHRTSSGRQLKQEKKEMVQERILKNFRFNGTLRIWHVVLRNSQSSTTKK